MPVLDLSQQKARLGRALEDVRLASYAAWDWSPERITQIRQLSRLGLSAREVHKLMDCPLTVNGFRVKCRNAYRIPFARTYTYEGVKHHNHDVFLLRGAKPAQISDVEHTTAEETIALHEAELRKKIERIMKR